MEQSVLASLSKTAEQTQKKASVKYGSSEEEHSERQTRWCMVTGFLKEKVSVYLV